MFELIFSTLFETLMNVDFFLVLRRNAILSQGQVYLVTTIDGGNADG